MCLGLSRLTGPLFLLAQEERLRRRPNEMAKSSQGLFRTFGATSQGRGLLPSLRPLLFGASRGLAISATEPVAVPRPKLFQLSHQSSFLLEPLQACTCFCLACLPACIAASCTNLDKPTCQPRKSLPKSVAKVVRVHFLASSLT